jgi:2'-phosphotransferase
MTKKKIKQRTAGVSGMRQSTAPTWDDDTDRAEQEVKEDPTGDANSDPGDSSSSEHFLRTGGSNDELWIDVLRLGLAREIGTKRRSSSAAGAAEATSARAAPEATSMAVEPERRIRLSKALSFVLRHGAASQGLRVDAEGFAHMADVAETPAMMLLHAKRAEIDYVIATDEKRRFLVEEVLGQRDVKAVQGHSIAGLNPQAMHQPVTLEANNLPECCVHGTFLKHLSIREKGLLTGGLKGDREHIHFQSRELDDSRVISGIRPNSEIAIYIDLEAALREGFKFYLSQNEVLLTAGAQGVLPARFITKVIDLRTRRSL